MSKLTSLIRRVPKRVAALVAIIATAIIVPAALLAYGPDRPTYTGEHPADHVTFNSITNNPDVGDERNFVRIKEDKAGATYGDNVNLEPGKFYDVMVYYHNNAASNLNASGVGVAKDVTLRMEMPAVIKSGVNAAFTGNISASNATPGTVWDEAYGKNTSNADVALRYVANSAKVTSNGAVNGQTLPDSLFTTGASLGYDSLNGILYGCNQYAGYVNFKVRVDQPNFTIKKEVSTDGKTWVDGTTKATAGSTIQYRITYENTGTTQQDNVSLRDILPTGVSYVPGSSLIANSTTGGQYKPTVDGITTVGYNAGSYQPKGNVYFKISAKVPTVDTLACGTNTLKNVARVTTTSGYKEDDATVTIDKSCDKDIIVCELATKKIVTIKESQFNSTKYSKNLKDCETPGTIVVCELATKKIVTINVNDFNSSKYSKNLDDCKVINKITVCEISTKKIVTILESDFNSTKYSKDLSACTTTPPELPKTGMGENIVAVLGLGALIASVGYYLASRRAAMNQ